MRPGDRSGKILDKPFARLLVPYATEPADSPVSIENVFGSYYDDSLFGDNGDNSIYGASGNDVLLGFGGNDWLTGSSGNDSLNGGAGLDLIDGGIGADTLVGGLDADTFLFETQYDSAGSDPSGIDYANTDVILDFNNAEDDKIDVHYIDANVKAPGDQDFTFVGSYLAHGGFTASGQVADNFDGTDTYLLFNTDDDYTNFEFAIRLAGHYTPDDNYFHL